MVLLLTKNSKAGCLFWPNFLKQAAIEIQKMEHPVKNFQSTWADVKRTMSHYTTAVRVLAAKSTGCKRGTYFKTKAGIFENNSCNQDTTGKKF